jgi:DNA-binding MarR family transcriptional regulator
MPACIVDEDPGLLMHLLNSAATDEGIAVSALQAELKIHQPRLSKLKAKLIREGLLSELRVADGRFRLVKTTPRALQLTGSVIRELNRILPDPPAAKGRRGLKPPNRELLEMILRPGDT